MPQSTPVDTSSPTDFCIFGSGILFSISPTIHNAGFKHYDLFFTYDIRESPSIDEIAALILNKQFGGGSDWSGLHAIIASFSTKTKQQPNVGLVIGAGGASRAALYSMHRAGV